EQRRHQHHVRHAVADRIERALSGVRDDQLRGDAMADHAGEVGGLPPVWFDGENNGHSYVRSMKTTSTAPARVKMRSGACVPPCWRATPMTSVERDSTYCPVFASSVTGRIATRREISSRMRGSKTTSAKRRIATVPIDINASATLRRIRMVGPSLHKRLQPCCIARAVPHPFHQEDPSN